MPFTKIDSWEAEPGTMTFRMPALAGQGSLSDYIAARTPRQLLGTVATLIVHAVAIYFLLTRLSQAKPLPLSQVPAALTLINLGHEPDAATGSDAPSSSSDPVMAPAEPVKPMVPAEWAMVQIKVARMTPAAPAPPSSSVMAPATAKGARGGGYDPYAGAAPEKLDRLLEATASASPAGPTTTLIEQLRQRLLEIDSRMRFPLTVRLTVAADGRIASASFIRSSMPAAILGRVGAELQGESLPALRNSGIGQARQLDLSL